MEKLVQSIKDVMRDRIRSPLFGSFVASWSIWNYKTIFVLLSTKKVEDKFLYLDSTLYGDFWSLVSYAFLYPLATSVLFILVFPYAEILIYKYWYKRQNDLKKVKQGLDDETPLTREESRKIRTQGFQLEAEYEASMSKKDTEIKNLREVIAEKDKEVSLSKVSRDDLLKEFNEIRVDKESDEKTDKELEKTIDSILVAKELNEDEIEILTLVASTDNLLADQVIEMMRHGEKKSKYLLREFLDKGYISIDVHTTVNLTTEGTKYCIENGIIK